MTSSSKKGASEPYQTLAAHLLLKAAPVKGEGAEVMRAWAREGSLVEAKRGEMLVRRQQACTHMVLVLDGALVFGRYLGQKDAQILGFLGPGDLIGAACMMDGGPVSYDLLAHSAARVMLIDSAKAREAISQNAELANAFARHIAYRARMFVEQLFDSKGQPLSYRLARLLSQVVRRFGFRQDGAFVLGVSLSQSDLASTLAVSRQQVNLELRNFAQRGLVRLSRGSPEILDFEGLLTAGGLAPPKSFAEIPGPTQAPGVASAVKGTRHRDNGVSAPFAGHRALLVEDEPTSRLILSQQLERAGLLVDTSARGDEGLERFLASPGRYRFVIVDEHMPGLSGTELTRRIREHELSNGGTQVAILGVSSDSGSADSRRFLAAGMNGHLAKPLRFQELQDALVNLLNASRTDPR